jgi:hypothetical protein
MPPTESIADPSILLAFLQTPKGFMLGLAFEVFNRLE